MPLTPTFYDGDEFGVLQDAEGFLPLNTQLVLYPATKSPVRLALEPFRVEPAVTGLDWPFTTIPRSEECFARQQPCELPSLVRATSFCPGIDRPASGFNAVTTDPIKILFLTKKNCCEPIGFPTNTKIKLSYPRHNKKLPGPCFKTDDKTLVHFPHTNLSPNFLSKNFTP